MCENNNNPQEYYTPQVAIVDIENTTPIICVSSEDDGDPNKIIVK